MRNGNEEDDHCYYCNSRSFHGMDWCVAFSGMRHGQIARWAGSRARTARTRSGNKTLGNYQIDNCTPLRLKRGISLQTNM